MPRDSFSPYSPPMYDAEHVGIEAIWQFRQDYDYDMRVLRKAIQAYVYQLPLVAVSGISLFAFAAAIIAFLEFQFGDSLGGNPLVTGSS